VIAAVAAAAALALPPRELLAQRWLHANRTHAAASLESPAQHAPAPPDLRILAQREFDTPGRYRLDEPATAPATQPWWSPALRWLAARWQQLWRALFGRMHVSNSGAVAIGDGLLVVAGLGLLIVALRLLREVRFAPPASRFQSQPIAAAPDERSLSAAASRAANRGDYGNAVLLLFAATIAALDRRGAVTSDRTATVEELRRQLRRHDASLTAPFDAVAAPFVARAYADRTVEAPEWQRALEAFTTMLREATQP
jgi:hypothetical protein